MRMYDLIVKKRNGEELSEEEIQFMIQAYTKGDIPDYQMSAMLMAIFFQKMTKKETLALTMAMTNSGDRLDLSAIQGVKVDKHSTGGVGDKTSITLTPLVAACGLKVAKMSGQGLGHTGGTIDKLKSFPGFSTDLTEEAFFSQVNQIGVAIMGQTANMAPADKKMYSLRDVTATVDNISLIASSIMSKKLAAGADAIVLDVKTGSGAFMKKYEDAEALATEMVQIGNGAGRKTMAVISNMDQPLGYAVGNALEVKEAVDTLKGIGPRDYTELIFHLGSLMLQAGGIADSEEIAYAKMHEAIDTGKAIEKLAEFVKAQGGNPESVYNMDMLPKAAKQIPVLAEQDGYVSHIQCDEIGFCSMMLGGGREKKEDTIDLAVGLILEKKVGDFVAKGDVLATLHVNDDSRLSEVEERLKKAYSFSEIAPNPVQMVQRIIKEA